ncbi:phosphopantetheine-binding protein [Agaribacterium sp. ZY112]|uniref:phosphopantetheine-binding protein n=1 Tax=Agaribacterium sp. ZY112 TaxID=3233574 RepID=UPI003523CD0C
MLASYQEFEAAIAELLDVDLEDLAGYEDSLLDFGLDSVQIMSLVGKLELQGIQVSFIELAANVELSTWWNLLSKKKENNSGEAA